MDILEMIPWGYLFTALGGGLLAWLLLRPVKLPIDPTQEEIRELEQEAKVLERRGGARSESDDVRLARIHAVLRRRRSREG